MRFALANGSAFEVLMENFPSKPAVQKIHYPSLEDAQLVSHAKAGEKAAYAELVRRWQTRVYSQCLRQLGEKSIAEEITQDIFLSIFRALPRFREEAKFSTWLFRIVINHCKNRRMYQQRRHRRGHEPIEGNNEEMPRELPTSDLNPEQELQKKRLRALLQTALGKLEEKQKQILILRDVQGLSYDEISDILDIPNGTVKSRIHRARMEVAKLLRGKISSEDIED